MEWNDTEVAEKRIALRAGTEVRKPVCTTHLIISHKIKMRSKAKLDRIRCSIRIFLSVISFMLRQVTLSYFGLNQTQHRKQQSLVVLDARCGDTFLNHLVRFVALFKVYLFS